MPNNIVCFNIVRLFVGYANPTELTLVAQTMFVDRGTALKIVIDRSNDILSTRPFADLIDFENLNQIEAIPNSALNLYDITVDTSVELAEVGIVRISPAVLTAKVAPASEQTV